MREFLRVEALPSPAASSSWRDLSREAGTGPPRVRPGAIHQPDRNAFILTAPKTLHLPMQHQPAAPHHAGAPRGKRENKIILHVSHSLSLTPANQHKIFPHFAPYLMRTNKNISIHLTLTMVNQWNSPLHLIYLKWLVAVNENSNLAKNLINWNYLTNTLCGIV